MFTGLFACLLGWGSIKGLPENGRKGREVFSGGVFPRKEKLFESILALVTHILKNMMWVRQQYLARFQIL